MLNLSLAAKVYLCALPTDMRRGFDGLMRMAEEHLQKNVLQGGLFVFVNRGRDRVKLLYWDQDGLAVWYKRLERGTFALPQVDEETVSVILSATELAMLLGGVDLKCESKKKSLSNSSLSANNSRTGYVYDTMSTDAISLPDDMGLCHELIRQQADTIRQSQRKIEQLENYLEQLLRRQFGPRRERLDPDQLALFDAGVAAPAAEDAVESEEASKSPRRRGGGRRPLPKELPRQRIEYQLPEAELPCPECGQHRQKIGEEVSEQLEFVPASLHVIQHVRFKYACRRCQEHVRVAVKPAQPIERGLPGPGLLAHTITSKYSDHLPLYRLEDIFARHGIELSRSTMCAWMRQSAELLRPLYELMVSRVLASKIIWTDDTPVPVLDRTLPKTRKGRFWVYAGDDRHPYSVYDYTASRNRDGPEQFLKGFRGYLQADAFSGYDRLCAGPGVTEVACWAHARRKFYDARTTASELAHEALARVGQLYELERQAKESSPTDRCVLRQRESVALLNSLGDWLLDQKLRVLPKSPLGQAISYALANWQALCRYIEDGELTIDNNLSERALRAQAVGRKNWLFVGSDNGGRTAAVLFSMTASCKRHGIDPFRYLADVLCRLPNTPCKPLTELLPDVWFQTHPKAARKRAA